MLKPERQVLAAERWRDSAGKGGFCHPTGFGKMYETINIIMKRMIGIDPEADFIIVVNTDELRTQWRKEIKIYLGEKVKVLVETINYFQINRLRHTCKLLILDEMSMYFSMDRQSIWNGTWVDFKYLLWLDATPVDRQKRDSTFYQMYPPVDTITVDEARDNKWITDFKIFNLGVELTEEEETAYKAADKLVSDNFNKFGRNFDLVSKCLMGEKVFENGKFMGKVEAFDFCCRVAADNGWKPEYKAYVIEGFPNGLSSGAKQIITGICAIWSPDKVMGYAKKVMAGIKKRTEIIYTASNKIVATVEIIKAFPNRKTIIFSQRTAFAHATCLAINKEVGTIAVEYHSELESRPLREKDGEPTLIGGSTFIKYKTGKNAGEAKIFGAETLRKLAIQHIKSGLARVLCTGMALDRGLDVPDMSLAIITGFTQNPSQSQQRRGRLTRVDQKDPEKHSFYVNLYVRGTKEEDFLKSAQAQFDEVFWIDFADEITTNPANKQLFDDV